MVKIESFLRSIKRRSKGIDTTNSRSILTHTDYLIENVLPRFKQFLNYFNITIGNDPAKIITPGVIEVIKNFKTMIDHINIYMIATRDIIGRLPRHDPDTNRQLSTERLMTLRSQHDIVAPLKSLSSKCQEVIDCPGHTTGLTGGNKVFSDNFCDEIDKVVKRLVLWEGKIEYFFRFHPITALGGATHVDIKDPEKNAEEPGLKGESGPRWITIGWPKVPKFKLIAGRDMIFKGNGGPHAKFLHYTVYFDHIPNTDEFEIRVEVKSDREVSTRQLGDLLGDFEPYALTQINTSVMRGNTRVSDPRRYYYRGQEDRRFLELNGNRLSLNNLQRYLNNLTNDDLQTPVFFLFKTGNVVEHTPPMWLSVEYQEANL